MIVRFYEKMYILHPCENAPAGVYCICEKRRKERDTMTNIFMKGDRWMT